MEKIKKNKKIMVIAIFVMISMILTVSFALFTYRRTGITKTTITSGYIEFSYIEGEEARITDAYPLSDEIGAKDETNEYKFEVGLKTSNENIKAKYEVLLLDNNREEEKEYFRNEQIKIAVIKNNTYVAETTNSKGIKLSEIEGFNEGSHRGEGKILENQEIKTGEKEKYKVRMWISEDVNYNNEIDEEGNMEGKYNSYTYSLRVKVNATGVMKTTTFENVEVTEEGEINVDVIDTVGLDSYALTGSSNNPLDSEWIPINDGRAKSKSVIEKIANIKSKHLTIPTDRNGLYYLHVKNKVGQISYERIRVRVFEDMIEGESILEILQRNEFEEGYYRFKVNEEIYRVHIYTYEGNQVWTTEEKTIFGDNKDVGSGTAVSKMAQRMVIVKVKGDLTIEKDVVVRPYVYCDGSGKCYGGPKGFTIYVTGTLTNRGTIDNSYGAYAEGQNVYLWKDGSGYDKYTVPKEGMVGASAAQACGSGEEKKGTNAASATGRETGGGGSGYAYSPVGYAGYCTKSGGGGRGTSYSGGAGGGGNKEGNSTGYAGSSVGGAGGAGRSVSGGVGNPGGNGSPNGTGGLLIIYGNHIINEGDITANGTGSGTSGGSSGGGSINIFYKASLVSGHIVANEGYTATSRKSGNGGRGTVTYNQIYDMQANEVKYDNSEMLCNDVECSLNYLYRKLIVGGN